MLPRFSVYHKAANFSGTDAFFLRRHFPQNMGLEPEGFKDAEFLSSPVIVNGEEK